MSAPHFSDEQLAAEVAQELRNGGSLRHVAESIPRARLSDLGTLQATTREVNGEPLAVLLEDFLRLELKAAQPLMGTDVDTILPAGGLAVVAGMPAVGKTTLSIDACFHLASGEAWLGMPVMRPLRVLIVENEGPQHKFQQKLGRKVAAWGSDLDGEIHVQTWRWGSFSFGDADAAQRMENYLLWNDISIVVGDPLDTLGPGGVGSPEDTREFVRLLVPLGLTTRVCFLFLHHLRKEASKSEIDEVSGAWGGRLDSLMLLKTTPARGELRLSFPKLRWAETRDPLILGLVRERQTFELLREERHEVTPDMTAVEAQLVDIVKTLQASGSALERNQLATRAGSPSDKRFYAALKLGVDRNMLAKGQVGKKYYFSLTEESW